MCFEKNKTIGVATMPQIHLIDGEKGGVGKSFFARALVYYSYLKNLKFYLVDSDRSNPDVAARYPEGSRTVFFSEVEKKANDADILFNLSLEKPVVVNLPSQIEIIVSGWIERNGLIDELGKEYGLEIYKWFLCTGAHDSNTLFIESAEKFGGKIQHILVQNHAFSDEDDWNQIFQDYPRLEQLINEQKIPKLILPRMGTAEKNVIDQHQWTFAHASSKENKDFSALPKQRVVNWLKTFVTNVDALNLLTAEAFKAHSAKPKKTVA
jgi:hypothetical protein